MLSAFVFSVLAQAPLILGGLLVYWFKIPTQVVGWLGGFGAGGLLAMLTNSLIPFSFTRGGLLTGVWAAAGFAVSLLQQ